MPKLLQQQPGGINIITDPVLGTSVETHSSTCKHCQAITDFESRKVMMNHVEICRGCMSLICLKCYGKPCRPYEQEAERQELEFKLRSRVHLQAWGCY